MSLRLQTNDLCEDKYFEALKHCVDANSQNIIGAIYLKNGNNQEAQKFFLRSLLLNDEENVSLNGFWQATSKNKKEPINQIVENCVCTLNNEAHTLHIAIHSANILEGIFSPTKFADCEHFSSEDMKVCSLLFHKKMMK